MTVTRKSEPSHSPERVSQRGSVTLALLAPLAAAAPLATTWQSPMDLGVLAAGLVPALIGAMLLPRSAAQIEAEDSAGSELELRLERRTRLYRMIRQLQDAIARASNRDQLQPLACRIAADSGVLSLAWIGESDATGNTVVPRARAGTETDYVDEIDPFAEAAEADPAILAFRERRVCVRNRLDGNTGAAWQTPAWRHGFRSAIALPLAVTDGHPLVLALYATEPGIFARHEIAMLQDFATDLANALRVGEVADPRRSSEQRRLLLGTALESTSGAIAISDEHDTIQWVNAAFVVGSGYSFDELVGRSARHFRSEHQPGLSEVELARLATSGQTWHGEWVSRRKNGQLYVEEVTVVPVRDADRAVRHFVSIRQDITSRKGAERRVREQAALLDQASEAIVVADLNHRVTFWNRGAEKLFGKPATAVLGTSLVQALAIPLTAANSDFQRALRTLTPWRGDIRTRDPKGEPLIVETSVTLLLDDAGHPTGRLYVSADVTASKALEEQFLRVQRMENIGMLAAGIAHDLNNILAPIRMVGPLLRDRLNEPRELRLLDTLESCATRGAALVRQILGFAHGVSGEHRLIQAKHVLRDVADVMSATFPKSIVLEDEIPADLWPINANPTQIHQVVLNLCVNARDAMPTGGTLRMRAMNRVLDAAATAGVEGARPGSWLVIEVSDTGTGITAEVLANMWNPLFTTKTADKGTGLGLSTVRGIVAQHEGFVTVETEVGHGSTFRVHFPAEASGAGTEGTATPFAAARAQGELVLFVDDESSICEVATVVLTRQGYRVLTASDGAEAVAQFAPRSSEVALVITDLDMPTLDGTALCRVIRALNAETKLLAISGFNTTAPDDPPGIVFLQKPFSPETLLAQVDAVLHGTRSG